MQMIGYGLAKLSRLFLKFKTRGPFLAIAALVLVVAQSGCARVPNEIIGVDNEAVPARSVSGAKRHNIYIATTREAAEDPEILFADGRSPQVSFAKVTVSIPPNHEIGNIERPKRLPPDPRTEFVVIDPELLQSKNAFVGQIDIDLLTLPNSDRQILLFIHGYNTTLSAAILRLAQFVEDSGFEGVPVLFTWASRGKTLQYVYDINSALHARDALLDTAKALRETKASSFDILAHSMGNLLTVEAMRQAKIEGWYGTTGRLQNVILASPDIDLDVFRRQIEVFPRDQRNFFVLISEDDRALAFSKRIAGGVSRLGDAKREELEDLGIVVIDLSEIDDGKKLSHSKFADSPEIVQLIGRGISDGNKLRTQEQLGNGTGFDVLPGLFASRTAGGSILLRN